MLLLAIAAFELWADDGARIAGGWPALLRLGERGESGLLGVSLNGCLDLEGECEGAAALFGGNAWRGALEDAGEEGFDFQAEGFARGDGGLVEGEAGHAGRVARFLVGVARGGGLDG